jgi:acetate---CoA ligase (ADP-forming)
MSTYTLNPSSIAIIGASASEHKVGHLIFKNLTEQGFEGVLYPVNPKGGTLLGKKVFTSLQDIDASIDMTIVVTPAKTVPEIAKECGEKGVQWLIVISAGFSEVHTDEGRKLEKDLVNICNQYSMKLIGPNCLGVLRPNKKMNASFGKDLPAEGNVALVSQSGAMAVAIMDASPKLHLGFSLILSIGNKAQMNECDFLELCEQDDSTGVIGLYLESIQDGRRFLETASRIAQKKKIVLLKAGVSEHGKKAASSHTGALAGSNTAIDAACVQTGIHRAHTMQEFFSLLRACSSQPPLLTENIGVITNAGGPGILATDAAEDAGLQMPPFTEKILDELKTKLPDAAGLVNPIDVIGDATTERYSAALEACGDDPQMDGIVVLLTPQIMTPCTDIAQVVVDTAKKNRLMPIVTSFMGGDTVEDAVELLAQNGIPNFETPEEAVRALSALRKNSNSEGVWSMGYGVRKTPDTILKGKSGLLGAETTRSLLQLYDIPLPQQALAKNEDEALRIAKEIGYPVIAKISSPHILHKTDVGGIKANLQSDGDVRDAYRNITKNVQEKQPDAELHGILIQKFLPVGNECIIGGLRDPSFGPIVMVGLGGIYTELFKDVAFRIAPIAEEDGYRMLQDLQSWKLLLGMRGNAQSDIDGVVRTLVAVSSMIIDYPEITELDFNPILVSENGVIIADTKIVCEDLCSPIHDHRL